MKILFLTQVLPYPPDSGPKVKTLNIIKYLAKQDHDITLVSFVRGDQRQDVEELKKFCREVYTVPMERGLKQDVGFLLRSIFQRQSFLMIRDERPAMHALIANVVSEAAAQGAPFDVVHADQLNMAQYALPVQGVRKLLDEHNALWLLYERLCQTMKLGPRRWALQREVALLKRYEGEICHKFDAVTAVSQEDKTALEEAIRQAIPSGWSIPPITVLPISVDTDEITPIERNSDASTILHIGTMYWPPNVDGVLWFLRQVYPIIRSQKPYNEVVILGAKPPEEVKAFGQTECLIHVTGYVKDPDPYVKAAAVMVVPLRAGAGMRVKILTALAQGLPVVTTPIGCEGIAVESGRHLLIADTPESFATATLWLLNDREMADDLGRSGRELMCQVYDYRVACRPLDEVYARLLAPAPKAASVPA